MYLNHSKKHSFLQNIVFQFLTLSIMTLVIVLYIIQNVLFYQRQLEYNYTCHYSKEGDALPSIEDEEYSPKSNSIFFHETSCLGGLTKRQACVVESAARAHPNRQIYVLFSSPVSEFTLKNGTLGILRMHQNINFARVHIEEYAKNTPLEDMVVKKRLYESQWWVEHTSDLLRSLTLYKWGGVYLDTDMLVAKSLTPLGRNWVGRESSELVNSAAIAVSMDELGRKLANAIMEDSTLWNPSQPHVLAVHVLTKERGFGAGTSFWDLGRHTADEMWYCESCLPTSVKDVDKIYCSIMLSTLAREYKRIPIFKINELKHTYRPDIWIHNGPGAITRVLHKLCNTHHVTNWSPSTCGGLRVYGREYFYPIHYSNSRVFFELGELEEGEQQAYTFHLWNKLTYNMTIEKDSPYMKLAQKYCPTIFHMYSKQFGI